MGSNLEQALKNQEVKENLKARAAKLGISGSALRPGLEKLVEKAESSEQLAAAIKLAAQRKVLIFACDEFSVKSGSIFVDSSAPAEEIAKFILG